MTPNDSQLPEPFDAEVAMHEVLGTKLGVTSEGPEGAPQILLLHGVPGSTRDYRYLAPLLSSRLRVHRVDLPGYGAAQDARWHDYSPDGRARLIIGAADALGVERFAVAGHSMGGPAAIATAAMVPHRVKALITIASVGVSRHQAMLLPPAGAVALRRGLDLPLIGGALLAQSKKAYRKMRFPTAETLTRRALAVDIENVMGIDFARARRRAQSVRAPTLVAYAEDDPMVEPTISLELARTIEGAVAAGFSEGGHNIQKSQAHELSRRIVALISP